MSLRVEAERVGTWAHARAALHYRKFALLDDGCWGWSGSVAHDGYGRVLITKEGRSASDEVRAHRLSYVIHHGAIPKGMHVLHSCDSRLCTNPLHLRLGTNQENMRDKMTHGNAGKRFSTEERNRWARAVVAGKVTAAEAARRSGASDGAVRHWVRCRRQAGLL